ncbi:MAG: DUF58 domain-containing protein [Rhodanobacteraceae bacterium]
MPYQAVHPVNADGLTQIDLRELIALRGQALRLRAGAAKTRTAMAGAHTTHLRGRGMDYAESRAYQAGDDARAIDWRRTARSGKPHTKLFREERERSLLLLIDTHATMRFGTRVRFKSVQAARAAAIAAWSAVRGGDRVGALAFGGVRDAVTPHGGVRGALGVLGAMARWDARGSEEAEPLSGALQRARRLSLPGSRVLLISDGQCCDARARATLTRLTKHVEVRVLIVVDALESMPPAPGSYAFETTSGRVSADFHSAAARLRFRDMLGAGHRALATVCDTSGVHWRRIATGEDPAPAIAALLNPKPR